MGKFETATARSIKVKPLAIWVLVLSITAASFEYITGVFGSELLAESLLLSIFFCFALYYGPDMWERRSHLMYPVAYGLIFGWLAYAVENLLLFAVFAVPI